jgi:hypothetical protein
MVKGNLNRAEAVAMVGEKAVAQVEAENCEMTGRVQTDGDSRVEFSASVECVDQHGDKATLVAYYYQEDEAVNNTDDLSTLFWDVEGYEVI